MNAALWRGRSMRPTCCKHERSMVTVNVDEICEIEEGFFLCSFFFVNFFAIQRLKSAKNKQNINVALQKSQALAAFYNFIFIMMRSFSQSGSQMCCNEIFRFILTPI